MVRICLFAPDSALDCPETALGHFNPYCQIKAAVLCFVDGSYSIVAVDRQNPRIWCARRHQGSLMTNEPWILVDDLTKHLGAANDSGYRGIDHKGLPAHKIGRLWKCKLSEVDD